MKKLNILIGILLMTALGLSAQSLINNPVGVSQNVVVTSSADPNYTIEVNFVSREGFSAADIVTEVGLVDHKVEYIFEFLDEQFVFDVTTASIAGSGKLVLDLTLQTPSGTLILFPTTNGTLQKASKNYALKRIDAASTEDDKVAIFNHDIEVIDSLLAEGDLDSVWRNEDSLFIRANDLSLDTFVASGKIYLDNELGYTLADTIRQANTYRIPKANVTGVPGFVNRPIPILTNANTGLGELALADSAATVAEQLIVGEDGTDWIVATSGYVYIDAATDLVFGEYWLSQTFLGIGVTSKGADSLCNQVLYEYMGDNWFNIKLAPAVCGVSSDFVFNAKDSTNIKLVWSNDTLRAHLVDGAVVGDVMHWDGTAWVVDSLNAADIRLVDTPTDWVSSNLEALAAEIKDTIDAITTTAVTDDGTPYVVKNGDQINYTTQTSGIIGTKNVDNTIFINLLNGGSAGQVITWNGSSWQQDSLFATDIRYTNLGTIYDVSDAIDSLVNRRDTLIKATTDFATSGKLVLNDGGVVDDSILILSQDVGNMLSVGTDGGLTYVGSNLCYISRGANNVEGVATIGNTSAVGVCVEKEELLLEVFSTASSNTDTIYITIDTAFMNFPTRVYLKYADLGATPKPVVKVANNNGGFYNINGFGATLEDAIYLDKAGDWAILEMNTDNMYVFESKTSSSTSFDPALVEFGALPSNTNIVFLTLGTDEHTSPNIMDGVPNGIIDTFSALLLHPTAENFAAAITLRDTTNADTTKLQIEDEWLPLQTGVFEGDYITVADYVAVVLQGDTAVQVVEKPVQDIPHIFQKTEKDTLIAGDSLRITYHIHGDSIHTDTQRLFMPVPFLFDWGQSNRNGLGDATLLTNRVVENFFVFQNNDTYETYNAGVNSNPSGLNNDTYSHDYTLGQKLVEHYGEVYYLPFGRGGRGAKMTSAEDFNRYSTGEYFDEIKEQFQDAIRVLKEDYKYPVFITSGVIHGERDAANDSYSQYENNLREIQKGIQEIYPLSGNEYIVQLGSCLTERGAFLDPLREQQANYANSEENIVLINVDAYCNTVGDDLHYDDATLQQLGIDIFDAIEKPVLSLDPEVKGLHDTYIGSNNDHVLGGELLVRENYINYDGNDTTGVIINPDNSLLSTEYVETPSMKGTYLSNTPWNDGNVVSTSSVVPSINRLLSADRKYDVTLTNLDATTYNMFDGSYDTRSIQQNVGDSVIVEIDYLPLINYNINRTNVFNYFSGGMAIHFYSTNIADTILIETYRNSGTNGDNNWIVVDTVINTERKNPVLLQVGANNWSKKLRYSFVGSGQIDIAELEYFPDRPQEEDEPNQNFKRYSSVEQTIGSSLSLVGTNNIEYLKFDDINTELNLQGSLVHPTTIDNTLTSFRVQDATGKVFSRTFDPSSIGSLWTQGTGEITNTDNVVAIGDNSPFINRRLSPITSAGQATGRYRFETIGGSFSEIIGTSESTNDADADIGILFRLSNSFKNTMYLSASTENVGIGNFSAGNLPTQKLDIDGAIRLRTTSLADANSIPLTKEGTIIIVEGTDATFTQRGFWGIENGIWVKL